jgi:hypothetical protein
MRDRAIAVVGVAPPAGYVSLVSALERWDATPRLAGLRSRTILIAGELDFPPAAEKRALAAALGADLVVVRGSRHVTPFDSVAVTNATLLALLNDEPLPPEAVRVRDDEHATPAWHFARGVAEAHAGALRIPALALAGDGLRSAVEGSGSRRATSLAARGRP